MKKDDKSRPGKPNTNSRDRSQVGKSLERLALGATEDRMVLSGWIWLAPTAVRLSKIARAI